MSPRIALLSGAVAVALVLGAAPASAAVDLTGTWNGDDDSTYTVTQSGAVVKWNGRSNNGRSWNHDFTGTYDAATNRVSGSFKDRPGYDTVQSGTITVSVDSNCRMSFVTASVGWGTGSWTKQNCKLNGPVPLSSVSNGCGGDWGQFALDVQNYVGDTSTFFDGPLAESFTVSFRPACNMHDAGYDGVKVRDPINGNRVVNYRTWSRKRVDDKFQVDMEIMCARQIPSHAKVARRKCYGAGGAASIGAYDRYLMVREIGMHLFDADPDLPGRQGTGKRRNN